MLLVRAMGDVLAPPEGGARMKDALGPQLSIVDVPGVGHALLPERPDAVQAATVEFLRTRLQ